MLMQMRVLVWRACWANEHVSFVCHAVHTLSDTPAITRLMDRHSGGALLGQNNVQILSSMYHYEVLEDACKQGHDACCMTNDIRFLLAGRRYCPGVFSSLLIRSLQTHVDHSSQEHFGRTRFLRPDVAPRHSRGHYSPFRRAEARSVS